MKNTPARLFVVLVLLLVSHWVHATPSSTNFQAYIQRPDKKPLESSAVTFTFRFRNPADDCTLYIEQFSNVSMVGSSGNINLEMGKGTPVFTGAGVTFLSLFNNATTNVMKCYESGNYTPLALGENRNLTIEFSYPGSNGVQMLGGIGINSVPYAMYAGQANDALRAIDFTGNLLGDITGTQGSTVVSRLRGRNLSPTAPTDGQVLVYSSAGSQWQPTTIPNGTVTSVTSGNSYVTITNSTSTPIVTLNVGTAANTVAAGDDSRIVNAILNSTPLGGDLSGNLPNPIVARVGTKLAAEIATSVNDTIAATAVSTVGTIVKRDASGDASFNSINAAATIAGVTVNSTNSTITNLTSTTGSISTLTSTNISATNFSGRNFLFYDNTNTHKVTVRAADPLAADLNLILPDNAGTTGYVLSTNGAGVTSWVANTVGSVTIVSGAAPVTVTGTASAPVVSMASATGSVDGYLTSANWTTFNNKQPSGNYITDLTGDVTATGPGSAAATIAANAVTNGKIAANAVNDSKISDVAWGKITSKPTTISGYGITDGLTTATIFAGDVTGTSSALLISNLARSKVAAGSANHVLINNGSGNLSSEAQLAVSRGGTGASSFTANSLMMANGSGTALTSATCNIGEILEWTISNTWACVTKPVTSSGGTVTNVTSANSYLSVATGSTTPALTLNVGTVANTVAAGNDSRFIDSRAPNGIAGGDLTGTYPNPTIGALAVTNAKINDVAWGKISSVPSSSTSTTGVLSSTDWNLFNGKQSALGYTPVNRAGDTMTGTLNLRTGTAVANTAPLKLTQGINLTTPESGAIEFDGTNLFYTDNTNTRKTLGTTAGTVSSVSSANADISVAGTTTPVLTLNSGTTGGAGDANKIAKLNASGLIPYVMLPVGTVANTVAAGNDSRFIDSRAPNGIAGGDLTGTYPNPTIGALAITNAKINDVAWGKITSKPTTISGYGITDGLTTSTIFAGDVTGTSSTTSVDRIKGTAVTISSLTSGNLLRYNGSAWVNTNLVAADIPNLDTSKITAGTLPVNRGGTGLSSFSANALVMANGSGTGLTSATCAVGQILEWTFSNTWACVTKPVTSSGGTVTNVTSANSYLTVANGATTPALTLNVGTVANTVAAGDDARFTNARAPSGTAGGDLTGTYPNPTIGALAVTNAKINDVAWGKISSVPSSSTSTTGVLSSTDWNLFNGKQSALGYTPVNRAGDTMTGALNGVAGSSAAPSFTTSANTGIFSQGANIFAIATNSVERMRIDASGNVGIGISPTYKLDVAGDINITGNFRVNGNIIGGGSGTVTTVSSTNSYLTVANGTTTPGLTLNVGTAANTVAAGDDARFTNSRAPNGSAGGDLTGSYPNPTIITNAVTTAKINSLAVTDAKINDVAWGKITLVPTASGSVTGVLSSTDWTTFNNKASTASLGSYVLKAGDTMTGTLILPGNGLVVGSNQLVASSGSVGVGRTPASGTKLDVEGQIAGKSGDAGSSGSIDFSLGNSVITTFDCGTSLSFSNLRDGGNYIVVVTGTGAAQCNFSTTTTGDGAATVAYRYAPTNGVRTATSHTVYNLNRVGNNVYVSWITGF